VVKLVGALEPHMRIEETLVYPLLPEVLGGERAQRFPSSIG